MGLPALRAAALRGDMVAVCNHSLGPSLGVLAQVPQDRFGEQARGRPPGPVKTGAPIGSSEPERTATGGAEYEWRRNVAVALLVYKRPEVTRRVFERVAAMRPPRLFVIGDGPASQDEVDLCKAVQQITTDVDWDCDVQTDFADEHLGCRARVISGLNWVFDSCERAIILEDDCLPSATFFRFCEELLEAYADDTRIRLVSGNNLQRGTPRGEYSYYFSRHGGIWGWASWSRAWKLYDPAMTAWHELKSTDWLDELLGGNKRAVAHWRWIFDRMVSGSGPDTWDYQWTFAGLVQATYAIVPQRNLVTNIGFGADATRTKEKNTWISQLPLQEMDFPLQHPPYLRWDKAADDFVVKEFYLPWAPTFTFRDSMKRVLRDRAAGLANRLRALDGVRGFSRAGRQ